MASDEGYPVVNVQTWIPVRLVLQKNDAINPEDDWTGLSDPSARRKLQNRLNQRAYRKRRAQRIQPNRLGRDTRQAVHHSPESQPQNCETYVKDTTCVVPSVRPKLVASEDKHNINQEATDHKDSIAGTCTHNFELPFGLQISHDSSVVQCGAAFDAENSHTLSSDHLIHLIQFNVYRALLSNVYTIGMTPELMQMDVPSPFTTFGPVQMEYILPPSLRPTWLQRCTVHHPYLDVFPIPFVRDKLLLADESFDEQDLCFDLVGHWHNSAGVGHMAGVIVWGEPWDPLAWEVTEPFAKKWSWLLDGCNEIIASTNYWRAKRGEGELVIDMSSRGSNPPFDSNTGI